MSDIILESMMDGIPSEAHGWKSKKRPEIN